MRTLLTVLFALFTIRPSFAITRSCSFMLSVQEEASKLTYFIDAATTTKATRTRGGESTEKKWRVRAKNDATNASTACLQKYLEAMSANIDLLPVVCATELIDQRPYRMPVNFFGYLSQEVCQHPSMRGRSGTSVKIVLSQNGDDQECVGNENPNQRDGGVLMAGLWVPCQ
jgi:hypothetical protein